MIAQLAIVFVFGLIIGSFLSVCIYRIPLGRFDQVDNSDIAGEDSTAPEPQVFEGKPVTFSFPRRSLSPCCKKQLAWWHNIPLISWLLLGGKCAFCKKSISIRYPVVELLTALCAFLSASHYGTTPTALIVFIFSCSVIVIMFIDYDYFIIPNLITYPGMLAGITAAFVNERFHMFGPPIVSGVLMCILGVLAGGGFLFFVSEVYLKLRKLDGLGMGDVKLLAMIGALFGPECALFTIFVGSLIGSIGGLLLVLIGGRRMSQHLPFGPSLVTGALLYLYFAQPIGEFLNMPLGMAVR